MRTRYKKWRGRCSGTENVPQTEEPLIFCCNHFGITEPFWVHVCIPRKNVVIMTKKELFKEGLKSWILYNSGAFPVDRERITRDFLSRCNRYISDEKYDMLMFGQGKRRWRGWFRKKHFRAGPGHLAYSNKVDVCPVYFRGTFSRYFIPGRMHVRFGPVVSHLNPDGSRKNKEAISDEVYEAILKMHNKSW